MVKKRARLNDENDPLSSTDRVLAGFEQIGKSASQQSNQSTSQQVDMSEGQQPTVLELASLRETPSQQPDKLTSQQDSKIAIQPPSITTNEVIKSQQPNQLTSQQDSKIAIQPPSITTNEVITSQQPNQLTSQQVDNIEKLKLRKSTFQISETVLNQLDQVHLTLQLELGKAIAPYKEVIVEEALVQLLEQIISDRTALIEVLASRQKSRDKP